MKGITDFEKSLGTTQCKPVVYPYYHVQITFGKLNKLKFSDYYFANSQLLAAREYALMFCSFRQYVLGPSVTDPRTLKPPYDLSKITAFSIEVNLVVNQNESYQIIGQKGEDALKELQLEAHYFETRGLETNLLTSKVTTQSLASKVEDDWDDWDFDDEEEENLEYSEKHTSENSTGQLAIREFKMLSYSRGTLLDYAS